MYHSSQIFLYLMLAFIAGVFIGSFFVIPQTLVWIGAAICGVLIAVFFRRDSKILNPKITFAAFVSLFVLFGIVRHNLDHTNKHILEKFAQASAQLINVSGKNRVHVTVYGYIDEEPQVKADKEQLILKSKFIESENQLIPTDERILIFTQSYPDYHYGQYLKIYGEPLLPQNFGTDINFDYISHLSKDQIYSLMKYPQIQTGGRVKLGFWEKTKTDIYRKIFTVRRAFEASINRSLSEPSASYINGILLGARSGIPDNIKQAFNRTSTSHILAISGYNITIIAWVISWVLLWFMRRAVAFWFSVAGIILFTIMTGAGASVVRAAVMGLLLLYANKGGRLYGAANAVVFAGAMMVLINPLILRYDIGFQLSFMAVLGLIYLAPFLEDKLEKVKLPKFFNIKENIIMSISAQILVLPLLLFYFKNLSIVSIPTNILVLPLVPYTMLLGFATGLAGLILPFLGQFIGYFAEFLSLIQLDLVQLFAKPAWAAIPIKFPLYLLVLIYPLIGYWLWHLSFKSVRVKAGDLDRKNLPET